MTFADCVLEFNKSLKLPRNLPAGIAVLNPYHDRTSFSLCEQFYRKYYNDFEERRLIVGINPGRLGGGITGIPFTDPKKLQEQCNIPNDLPKKVELSSDYIYRVIEAFGGTEKFYSSFYFTAVSPLGFTKAGKNLNYYDNKQLQESLMDFILACMQKQLTFNVNSKVCYCLGEGQNFAFLKRLNDQHNFFKTVIPLPHPRFIMQYKRKSLHAYVEKYVKELSASSLTLF